MGEELRDHLERQTAANIAAGMAPDEARRQARLQLGALEGVKESCREERRGFWLETLWADVRYALRMLRKNPGFTTVALLTLALGIGANTAIFSVIEAVVLRPLPYKDPEHLALLADAQDPQDGGFLFKDIDAFRTQSRSLGSIACYYRDSGFSSATLTGGEPESVQGAFITANFFTVMGVAPALGRGFTSEEETRRERVVVLSHGLWVRRFGGARDAIGRALQIDGADWQIIGVMPSTFQFPARDQQFWAPLTTNHYWNDPELTAKFESGHTRFFYERWQAIGRLASGATFASAQADTNAILARIRLADPDENRESQIKVTPLRVSLSGSTRLGLIVLFCAVFFVLLIACSNVANLVLARGATRERELAIRAVLGAGRGRLVRQLLAESVVLGVLGGAFGLAFAVVGMPVLIASAPPVIPRLNEARFDPGVLAFTLAASLFAAVIFGLLPAWKASRNDPSESLKGGIRSEGPSLTRARSTLVIVELALAVVLLSGAGLLVRSLAAAEAVDLGFRPERVLTMNIALPSGTPESRDALYDAVLERAGALPEVEAAGEVDALFELGTMGNLGLRAIEGRAPEPRDRWTPLVWSSIRGEFFQAMGAPLLRGRYFTAQDGPHSALVAIIDESVARRYWPGQDPLGKRFKGQDPRGQNDDWLTVIGVVGDMRRSGRERNPIPHVFEPSGQAIDGDRTSSLVVRTTGDPRTAAVALRKIVRQVSDTAVLSSIETIEQQLSNQLLPRRFQTWLLGLFSAIALALAAVGIFGVMHYTVSQRTHEIRIRGALGAQPGDILRLVLRQGAKLALAGVAMGLCAALALTRFMASLLFGVSAADPFTFVGVPLLLLVVALLAGYIPARRAMRVDPMVALRYE